MDMLNFFNSWLLPIVLLLSLFIYARRRKSLSMAGIKLPPSPPMFPYIGNLHQVVGKEMYQTIWKLSQKYGPIMRLHFGAQPFRVISSTEMASQVLKTHDHVFCTRPYSEGSKRLSFNYMDIAFSPYGDHWRDMRKVLVSEFLGGRGARLFNNLFETEMEGLLHSLSFGTEVNLDDKLLHLVNDVVCKVTFGKSYRGERFRGKTMKELVDDTMILLTGSFSENFPVLGWIVDKLRGWNGKMDECFSNIDGFLEMIIDQNVDRNASKTSDGEQDFVDACTSRLTKDEIKGVLLNVLNGAIDTTAITLVWAMSEIVKNPRVMQKLQSEIRRCVGRNSKIQQSDIPKMTYLKMVVKETLRLHPPSPFLLPRECMSHCQIGGYDILLGTKVMINAWAIGRDPRVWKESATKFYPERFEELQVDLGGKHFEMIPFGGGRRSCPGYNSAISTIELTLANLLYWFDWKSPDDSKNEDLDMEEEDTVLVRKKPPLCLVPIKHNWQD